MIYFMRFARQRNAGGCQYYPTSAKNDSMLVGWASRAFFTELLAAGVKIYQFEGGLLHTRACWSMEELSLVGTVNLDMRSLAKFQEITGNRR